MREGLYRVWKGPNMNPLPLRVKEDVTYGVSGWAIPPRKRQTGIS